jgi:N-acetylneuraminic acid mutarotase/fibronectin type 3 domain-containing protein
MRDRPAAFPLLAIALSVLMIAPGAGAVRVADYGDPLPADVHGYGGATVGDEAYLFGGGSQGSYVDDIVRVTADGTPEVVGSMPEPIKEPAAASHEGTIYVFGGATESSDGGVPTTESTIYEFNPTTGEVNQLLGAQLPTAVSSASAVTVDDRIFVLGGLQITSSQDGAEVDYVRTIVRFDPTSDSTETLDAKLPTGRAQMAQARDGSSVVLMGGHAEAGGDTCPENANTCFSDEILRFTPSAGNVGTIGELPERVRWSASTTYEDTVYLLGGCRANCRGFQGTAAIVTVDPGTGESNRLPVTMPNKGGRNEAFTVGKEAIVPGGVKADSNGSKDHDEVVHVELGATRPWAPVNLTATADDGSARLTWDEPDYDGGSPIRSYIVLRGEGAREPTRIDEVTGTSYDDRNATTGTTYTYQVKAANRIDASIPSRDDTVTITTTPGPVPVLAQGADEKLVLQWSSPEEIGGENVTDYRVFAYTPGSDPNLSSCDEPACWDEVSSDTERVTVETVQGEPVENGQSYEVRVQARNANGWGDLGEAQTVTAQRVPDAPDDLTAQRTTTDGDRAVNLTWSSSLDPTPDSYVVYQGSSIDALAELVTTTETQHVDADEVPAGHPVYYAVSARADGAEGPLSEARSVVFAQPPGPVERPAARWVGGVAKVSWNAPEDTGGRPIQTYQLARTKGDADPEEADATIHNLNEKRYEDSDPPRGTTIVYHIRAETSGGVGEWNTTNLRISKTDESAPPDARIAAHPTETSVGGRVIFDASGSRDDEGVVAYNFDFGDGEQTGWRSDPRVTHTYSDPGVYDANVNVRDVSGLEDRSPAEITIAVGPEPADGGEEGVDPNASDGADGESNDSPALPAGLVAMALASLAVARRRER